MFIFLFIFILLYFIVTKTLTCQPGSLDCLIIEVTFLGSWNLNFYYFLPFFLIKIIKLLLLFLFKYLFSCTCTWEEVGGRKCSYLWKFFNLHRLSVVSTFIVYKIGPTNSRTWLKCFLRTQKCFFSLFEGSAVVVVLLWEKCWFQLDEMSRSRCFRLMWTSPSNHRRLRWNLLTVQIPPMGCHRLTFRILLLLFPPSVRTSMSSPSTKRMSFSSRYQILKVKFLKIFSFE